MKYIEELSSGDIFTKDNHVFLLTSDFKKNGNKLSYNIKNGNPKWFESSDTVELYPLYYLDENNNVISIKDSDHKAPNFS